MVGDCEEIFGQLLLGVWVMVFTLTENQELDASLFKDPFHEFIGKAAQPVSLKLLFDKFRDTSKNKFGRKLNLKKK